MRKDNVLYGVGHFRAHSHMGYPPTTRMIFLVFLLILRSRSQHDRHKTGTNITQSILSLWSVRLGVILVIQRMAFRSCIWGYRKLNKNRISGNLRFMRSIPMPDIQYFGGGEAYATTVCVCAEPPGRKMPGKCHEARHSPAAIFFWSHGPLHRPHSVRR